MTWVRRLAETAWVAHWLRAVDRFTSRLGVQFAAALTYFSVLSVVPILMVAFAAVGLTVTTFVPDVLDTIKAEIIAVFSGQGAIGKQLVRVVDAAFNSWQAVGLVGLLIAAWTGSTWVTNLRAAIRAQTRAALDVTGAPPNPVVQALQDLAMLFVVLLLIALTLALSAAATSLRPLVSSLLRLDRVAGGDLLLSFVPLAASLAASFLLFFVLFRIFVELTVPLEVLAKGSLIGAVGMVALQYAAGLLIGVFNNNPASAVFGNVIVAMLFLNLLATLILLVACWLATAEGTSDANPGIVAVEDMPQRPSEYVSKQLVAELKDANAAARAQPRLGERARGLAVAAAAALAMTRVADALARLRRRPVS